jgi:hypothetical protein
MIIFERVKCYISDHYLVVVKVRERLAVSKRAAQKIDTDQRKQAKLQWLQDTSEANEGNLNDIRREASRHFRNKKRKYLKDKINEIESNSKNKKFRDLYRGINEFKKGYQPRTNLVKDERGDLVADSHKISNRWKNCFC